MKKFQIQFVVAGSGSYKYFETNKDDYKEKACEIANAFIANNGGQRTFAGINSYRPIKTVNVVEYDKSINQPVKGGIKFKLKLSVVLIHM